MIALDHVTKQFDGKRRVVALDDVSLTIEKGEMVSVIGPSGSGKSTLLNLVGALDSPTSGKVLVDGQALDGLADDDLARVRRDKVGFIFQFFNLLPTLSCLENVGLPLHLRGWPRRKVDERAQELLGAGATRPSAPSRAGGAVRRRAPARGHRPRAVGVSAHPPRGRTDRQPRFTHRHRDPRAHPRPSRAPRFDRRHRHARHEGRRELRPDDCPPRRQDRRGRAARALLDVLTSSTSSTSSLPHHSST